MARPHCGVTNGDCIPSIWVCAVVPITIGSKEFVLPLINYELVLGCHWLKSPSLILWDLGHETMAFRGFDHCVRWTGVATPSGPYLHAAECLDLLQLLLAEFSDIFNTL